MPEVRGWVKPLGSTCEGIHVAWAACLMQGASWRLRPLAEHDAFLLPTCSHACRLTCPPHTGGPAHGGGGGQECGGVQLAQNHRQPRVVTRARWGLQAGEADAKLMVACHGSRQGRVAWHAISMAWRDPGMSYLLLMPWCAHGTASRCQPCYLAILPCSHFAMPRPPIPCQACHAKSSHWAMPHMGAELRHTPLPCIACPTFQSCPCCVRTRPAADDEKAYIRATAMASLLGDPSDRVALQASRGRFLACNTGWHRVACRVALSSAAAHSACSAIIVVHLGHMPSAMPRPALPRPLATCGICMAVFSLHTCTPGPVGLILATAHTPTPQVTLLITNIARFDVPLVSAHVLSGWASAQGSWACAARAMHGSNRILSVTSASSNPHVRPCSPGRPCCQTSWPPPPRSRRWRQPASSGRCGRSSMCYRR